MPEINRVPFKYDPVPGDLYLDHFRQMFFMERLDAVVDALQNQCEEHGVVGEIEGELFFQDGDEPPAIRDVRYASFHDRKDQDDPFPWTEHPLDAE